MTRIDYQWYWGLANQVSALSNEVTTQLSTLDGELDVANSSGTHSSAGHTWATAYDQSASDIFELASLTAIAAGNLAEMIHAAGQNHATAENLNAPEHAVEIPGAPSSTGLTHAIHPTGFSSGGIDDKPGNWWLVDGRTTKRWADPDTGKIRSAGLAFAGLSAALGNITIDKTTPDDPPPDVGPINGAVDRLYMALEEIGFACGNMDRACDMTASASDMQRDSIRDVLTKAAIVYWITATLPRGSASAKRRALDSVQQTAAMSVDRILIELDALIAGRPEGAQVGGPYPPSGTTGILGSPNPSHYNASQRGGTYASATSTVQNQLAPMLGRYARQVNGSKITGGRDQFTRMGLDGEERAGFGGPQREITINGRTRRPDFIDADNGQVVEVKNKNALSLTGRRPDLLQVQDSIDYAEEKGYTAVLVVDHRTYVPAEFRELESNGDLTIVRRELYDNLPWDHANKTWQEPQPFIPKEDWTPPNPENPRPKSGYPK